MKNKFDCIPPSEYAAASALANEVGEQMLMRLDWVTFEPKLIVDVGCGVGRCADLLQNRYPAATVFALDNVYPMLQYAKQQEAKEKNLVCADALALPFPDHSVDLIFANFVLPWCDDVEKILREWRRVLRQDGLLMFSSLGPDTLLAWREILADVTLPDFVDMHNQGDALIRARFADPVMDVDYITLRYKRVEDLLHELWGSGMIVQTDNLLQEAQTRQTAEGNWTTVYEVVYGHAWGPIEVPEQAADKFGVVKFPLSHLRRRV